MTYTNLIMFDRGISVAEKYTPFTVQMTDFVAGEAATVLEAKRLIYGYSDGGINIASIASVVDSSTYRAITLPGIWLPGDTPVIGTYVVRLLLSASGSSKIQEANILVPITETGTKIPLPVIVSEKTTPGSSATV